MQHRLENLPELVPVFPACPAEIWPTAVTPATHHPQRFPTTRARPAETLLCKTCSQLVGTSLSARRQSASQTSAGVPLPHPITHQLASRCVGSLLGHCDGHGGGLPDTV
eukprot:3110967-Alexandrium_andersonii.AAC.1